ncbi:MAG: hypothetical protein HY903_13950 [Deltaproteobacteria bacterium]|nr:hypothetical protein [Deltaproteobacteria bacterium]
MLVRPALCLAVTATVVSTPALAAGDLDRLVDQMAAAYGGKEALAKMATLTQTGRVAATIRVASSGPLVRIYARSLKLRVEIGAPTDAEVRVLDGKRGWRNGREVSGPPYEAMVLQAVRLDLPFALVENRQSLVDRGLTTLHGKEVHTVELPIGAAMSVTVGIEPTTGRVVYSAARL